jgi:hypothetical protein
MREYGVNVHEVKERNGSWGNAAGRLTMDFVDAVFEVAFMPQASRQLIQGQSARCASDALKR